jgi:hypothetical protein
MASGHMNRVKRPDTWLHRPMLQNVKKVLANPEPSTHDPNETSALVRRRPDRSRLRIYQARLRSSKSGGANSRINSCLMAKSTWAVTLMYRNQRAARSVEPVKFK